MLLSSQAVVNGDAEKLDFLYTWSRVPLMEATYTWRCGCCGDGDVQKGCLVLVESSLASSSSEGRQVCDTGDFGQRLKRRYCSPPWIHRRFSSSRDLLIASFRRIK